MQLAFLQWSYCIERTIRRMLYSHFLKLVFGVRLLLETSKEEAFKTAESMLGSFCSNNVSFFDNSQTEAINGHLLQHLAFQVRMFGALFAFSAMSFEAASRKLGEVYSGSVDKRDVICTLFLYKET